MPPKLKCYNLTVDRSGSGLALILTRHSSPGIIVIPLLVLGVGVGCVFQPTLVALQAHSPKSRRAVIISNRNFFRSAGGACGLAVSAAVLQARLRATLPSDYGYLADSTYALPDSSARDDPGVLDAYMAASRAVFILQVPLIGLCFLGTAFIRDRGLEPPEDKVSNEAVRTDGDEEQGPATIRVEDGPSQNEMRQVDVPDVRVEAGISSEREKVALHQ